MALLGTLGNNAPFIGLFGTVLGVIEAFHQLGDGANKAAMGNVMSGIAEALVATGVGLFVAIPAVVAYNMVQKRIGEIENGVGSLGKLVTAALRTDRFRAKGPAATHDSGAHERRARRGHRRRGRPPAREAHQRRRQRRRGRELRGGAHGRRDAKRARRSLRHRGDQRHPHGGRGPGAAGDHDGLGHLHRVPEPQGGAAQDGHLRRGGEHGGGRDHHQAGRLPLQRRSRHRARAGRQAPRCQGGWRRGEPGAQRRRGGPPRQGRARHRSRQERGHPQGRHQRRAVAMWGSGGEDLARLRREPPRARRAGAGRARAGRGEAPGDHCHLGERGEEEAASSPPR